MSTAELPDLRPTSTIRTIPYLGKFRILGDLEVKEMMFLFLAFVSVFGTAILTVVRIIETSEFNPELNFAILLMLNLVFILYYIVHGVFCERPFELQMSIIGTLVVMLYSIVEFSVHGKDDVGNKYRLKLGRLIAVCALGPVDIVLGCVIAFKFYVSKNIIYRTVGGNTALQGMCQTMFIFTAFLKFDFQLVLSLLVLILVGNNHVSVSEKLVIGLGTPYSFLWVILAFLMLRYESKKMAYAFWLLSIAEPIYIVFLFVRNGNEMSQKTETAELLLQYCIIFAGALGLIIRIVILVLSYFVVNNFGKGLKEKVYATQTDDTRSTPNFDDSVNE